MTDSIEGSPSERWKAELEEGAPRRRRGMPMWFWGCGGGCLLMLALFIGGTIYVYSQFQKLAGPEVAWPALAEVMPYGEERPDGYQPTVFDQELLRDSGIIGKLLEKSGPGASANMLVPVGHRVLTILEDSTDERPAGSGTRVSLWQLGPGDSLLDFTMPATFDELQGEPREKEETVQLVLQGRPVTGERADIIGQELPFLGEQEIQELVIDISGTRRRPLMLRMVSTGETKATEEELNRFLAPFQVWPDEDR